MVGTYVIWLRCEGKVYVMNAFGETGDVVALVLSLGIAWISVVSFTSRFRYPRRRNRVSMGPIAGPDDVTREKLTFSGNRTIIFGYPARSFVFTSYACRLRKQEET